MAFSLINSVAEEAQAKRLMLFSPWGQGGGSRMRGRSQADGF